MDLFTPIVPIEEQHHNFRTVSLPSWSAERAVVQAWAEGFPDRDKKFVTEFQTTFNSSFWEVYLYALFKEYGHEMDWAKSRPDFHLKTPHGEVIVEAVTANASEFGTPEWEKKALLTDDVKNKNFWPLNREAIIRLSNALDSKRRKYSDSYQKLAHVTGKPFVIAVAPFEQPDFQHQYDRPIRALLYDEFIDETAYHKSPHSYPEGPPSVQLKFVEKDNGSSLEMGIFAHEGWRDVSAVIFSCVATWGKAVAMSNEPQPGFVMASWGTNAGGLSERRMMPIGVPSETISDGLQVFHNPYARHPLPLDVFRRKGVVQHYFVPKKGWFSRDKYIIENYDECLQFRLTHSFNLTDFDQPTQE